ncbi:MAG: protein kinase [Xanthobacteraceae bacterium]|nr:protein kinase [Xanthobacteraceae bacterium]
MPRNLQISLGQFSDKGRKEANQDFYGALIPREPLLGSKGIALALADGISSSDVSSVASETAVKNFLTDYYCTSEAWSVKTSASRVIAATNAWLHAQTQRSPYRYDQDRGYVCTFSALILKSATAHIFHIGDARIYRAVNQSLEQITTDHRVVISSQQSYLGRALGVSPDIEIDYRALPLHPGDVFVLATDGVYEHASPRSIVSAVADHRNDLDAAAKRIVDEAFAQGSNDNLTVQILRVDALADGEADEILGGGLELPAPPLLQARDIFEGYTIVRQLHASSRSHIYLAADIETGSPAVIKIPSIDLRDDPAYIRRFMMEEWIARRLNSPYVLKPVLQSRQRQHLFVVTEHIEGQTLTQWMIDNPAPDIETVRGIVEQIASGLRAFHRKEMLHQDLRPENVMIDKSNTVKIIDFGSVKVAGVVEIGPRLEHDDILGTVQYTAPEYFVGDEGTTQSDLFSLGIITYQMLTGRLPYGTQVAKIRTKSQQKKLRYTSAQYDSRAIPRWIDETLRKAVHPDPSRRHQDLSEFVFDLRHPNPSYLRAELPLIERDPLLFWKILSTVLGCAVLALLAIMMRS